MTLCYPADTDWSCAYTDEQLATMRADAKTAAQMERSEMLAWYTLAALTGYQVGVCPTVLRPIPSRCAWTGTYMAAPSRGGGNGGLPMLTIGQFMPYVSGGAWYNACVHSGPCGCSHFDAVPLPGPVGAIVSVVIDEEVIAPTRYRVDNNSLLVSTDPELVWPANEDGTFVVTYYRGMAPNEMSRYAAGILAAEFFKACTGAKGCRLPKGVTTVVRGGTTIELQTGLFLNGDTGIPEVNAVIRVLNPHGLKAPSGVTSPDAHTTGRRQTWIGA